MCDLGQEPPHLWTLDLSAVKLRATAMFSHHVLFLISHYLFLITNCAHACHKVFPLFPPNSFFLDVKGWSHLSDMLPSVGWKKYSFSGCPQMWLRRGRNKNWEGFGGQCYQLIHLLSQYLLSPYCVPGPVLGPENSDEKCLQRDHSHLQGLHIWDFFGLPPTSSI